MTGAGLLPAAVASQNGPLSQWACWASARAKPDLAVDALVARSAAAQQSIAGWHEGRVDDLITALATQIAALADELAAAAVAETGIGCVPDKADKNRFASLDVARSLVGKPGWASSAATSRRR